MYRFHRQMRIPGWDQSAISRATVVVCGGGWAATFTVLALQSLGVGQIVWIGAGEEGAERLGAWLCSRKLEGTVLRRYPMALRHPVQVRWATPSRPDVLVSCLKVPSEMQAVARYCAEERVNLVAISGSDGGWFGQAMPGPGLEDQEDPVLAMIVAALAAERVRQLLCPLAGDVEPEEGHIGLRKGRDAGPGRALLVGVGGIGSNLALLAALAGWQLILVDHDRVDSSNLNRQLFTAEDAEQQRHKVLAAIRFLRAVCPSAEVRGIAGRLERDSPCSWQDLRANVILSAVDNARTRLIIQHLGNRLGIPVVQGSTDMFAADCLVQWPGGPSLDEQMHGALRSAATRERGRSTRSCGGDPAYVVAGMMAAALMAWRMSAAGPVAPLCWRSGYLPREAGVEVERPGGDGAQR